MSREIRIGIDLGGTKIEAIALDGEGAELRRHRVPTPRDDYDGTVDAIAGLVRGLEAELVARGTVGVGMPGTISPVTGLVKNANSTWLNGRAFDRDLSAALDRPVLCTNDANCFAVSEATDGAGAGAHVVFAVIVGTGCGAGLAIEGRAHVGPNAVAGEWGHNPLPWPTSEEYPGARCYCGRTGCIETWISGSGLARDFAAVTGRGLTGPEIVAAFRAGDPEAVAAMARYRERLGRSLAHVVNLLDPDVLVLGGGMSNVAEIYVGLPEIVRGFVFGGDFSTPIRRAQHGDSSGVRGAAWLWPDRGRDRPPTAMR